jgi:hypothetical protein
MPDRLIRDELLTSERYWSVSIEAQRLFFHLLLVVDGTARFSGKNYTLRTACFPGHPVEPEKLERLLTELYDVDLIRFYQVAQERYVFVPRFKQRLRFRNSKYPEPPKQINDIPAEKSDSRLTRDGLKPDSSPQKRSEVKRSEDKKVSMSDSVQSVWDMGVTLLGEQGVKEGAARVFLGSLLKEWDEPTVEQALRSAVGKAQAQGYIRGFLKSKPKKGESGKLRLAI